ncbi:MAG TPA: aldehyde:ferredoxin oxidoreductase [Armatimonadetes bacterium]|nr:aldehyde:ferredoxin oxidoreductase [Armatimonadota bacterium]
MLDPKLSRVLYIDLTHRRFEVRERPELFTFSLGGTGVAIQLLAEECPPGADPLGPENPIVFAVGPLTSLFPLASKTVAMFKSPHTGNLGESHAGGRSAIALREAGYGALVIRGASDMPVYLAVHGPQVFFRDASALWGMRSCFTVGRILREVEPKAGLRTIMRIGQAGENLVTYAGVTTETYRHFGRLGLGAVFGSKKLKAVVISGRRSIPVSSAREYREVYDEIYTASVESDLMRKYHDLGTAENVLPLNELGGLPVRNLQAARYEGATQLSGEALAEHYLGRRLSCAHCPIGCIHLAALREPYEDEPYFYKTSMISYDYEPLYALGTMLGGQDPVGWLQLMDEVETRGLDALSTGVVLAWATEAQERGLISEKETLGLRLTWGDYPTYIAAVQHITARTNEFYRALGWGVDFAAAQYGGEDFALAFGGNEMPGYHTGPAAHLTHLTGARHSHLDSAGYSLDQKVLLKQRQSPQEVAAALVKEESWRQILSSLVVCFFARRIYRPEMVVRALSVAGFALGEEDLFPLGREILRWKVAFKEREGFDLETLRIPQRILETPSPAGPFDEAFLREAMRHYRQEVTAHPS